ncbi:carbohydrate esterase family 4 [Micractinium conductrix]|uniref:Carbohydrate esterase family 4 n=1 Tax=Micractinium conductrix TaxID=554055 RepID=A0A2P6VKS4_9CHLO|nr:carbohydrate esterase family 4 [Micractinium conductrix]|eukprot:PSC74660.1 carbohydrate esterase family 4 [Micractinium conductrix]
MRAAVAALALLAAACLVSAQEPVQVPGYNCPATCLPPKCKCASYGIPGGLTPGEVPQFVVLTNDDAITVTTKPVIMDITKSAYNPQGCAIPATWFVSQNYTDYHLVQEVYMANHEIASHTLHHVADPDLLQIVGMKLWLNQTAHVPLEKIRGFRAPFLMHTPEQRKILQENGFTYDSSIPEPFPTATSPDESNRLWPYTMDNGLPQRCDLGTGPCSVNETLPGLWEVPMWDVQNDAGVVLTNMDPQGNIAEAYKREFDRSYNGNKAPVGVYIHAAWLMDPTRAAEMKEFINYALGHENTWFVTMSELIDWVKKPVDATKYRKLREKWGCEAPTDMWFASGSFCESVACVNGNFTDTTCSCTCIAEYVPTQAGWCADPTTGACTIPKVWNDANKAFECPAQAQRSPEQDTGAEAVQSPWVDPAAANCGHPLQDFSGLGMSGTQDNSALYTQALRAVDGLCDTCASATDARGNYFTVVLPAAMSITSIQLTVGEDIWDGFIFVGDSSSDNGMTNPACAMNLSLEKKKQLSVECSGQGKYVTLASAGNITLCDIYIQGYELAPSYPPPAGAAAGPPPAIGETPTGAGVGGATADALVDQLLGGGGGSFATTSDEEGSAIDHSRVGMDGVQADPHAGDGAQQLIDLANAELAAINSALGIKN